MAFEMPFIGQPEIALLTKAAYERACWDLSHQAEFPDFKPYADESCAAFKAWIDYSRQAFPTEETGYMLDYEAHWGCKLPFSSGDHWEFSEDANSWVVVKPKGKRIITRNPKKGGL
jgi:hypothetical protein